MSRQSRRCSAREKGQSDYYRGSRQYRAIDRLRYGNAAHGAHDQSSAGDRSRRRAERPSPQSGHGQRYRSDTAATLAATTAARNDRPILDPRLVTIFQSQPLLFPLSRGPLHLLESPAYGVLREPFVCRSIRLGRRLALSAALPSISVSIVGRTSVSFLIHSATGAAARSRTLRETTTPAVFVSLGRRGLPPRARGPAIRARKSQMILCARWCTNSNMAGRFPWGSR